MIYLVTPTLETVNLILKDFADPKKPRYGDVHLFFLSKVNDALMHRLGTNPGFLQRVKTFKEINMNFLATEASAFHLDMPRCLPALFTTRPDNGAIEEVVHKLVSLCVTLNEYPHVRYNQNSVLGARIATLIQDALNVRAGLPACCNGWGCLCVWLWIWTRAVLVCVVVDLESRGFGMRL